MSEWISVDERLPEQHICCLTFGDDFDFAYMTGSGGFREWSNDQSIIVTHWQPLPEPPK